MTQLNHAADTADDVWRMSLEATATVTGGPLARGGKTRVPVQAAAHDVQPLATVTPVGRFLPTWEDLFGYGVTSQVTSACLVDRLAPWWEAVRERCAPITTLVRNVANGPEHQSRRPQCMQRMVACVHPDRLTVRRASSPPYHRKDNPIARGGGLLEHHGNGTWLDSMDPVLQCARPMTWNGTPPLVALVTTTYQTGVKWTQEALGAVEAQSKRLPYLGKWFVDIVPPELAIRDT